MPGRFRQPLDRGALGLGTLLVIVVLVLLLWGDRTAPQVRSFSWANRDVGTDDPALLFTFDRPMDPASVEQGFRLEPPLPGRFSWAGRRMAYTPDRPLPYGQTFRVQLSSGQGKDGRPVPLRPYRASFRTRHRAFAYLGQEGNEAGRLVLYDLTTQRRTPLTAGNLRVLDFLPYPQGNQLLVSAIPAGTADPTQAQLYRVSTGLDYCPPDPAPCDRQPRGQMTQLLDSQDYQNLRFDLAADGRTIVVQRVARNDPSATVELWRLREGEWPRTLARDPGGEFLIAPDSTSLAIAQGQGLAVLSLDPELPALDFLPKFGRVLRFAPDGSQALVVRFNPDFTQSLYRVGSAAPEQLLLRWRGSFEAARFDPSRRRLYLLVQSQAEGQAGREQILSLDLSPTGAPLGEPHTLVELGPTSGSSVDLAPDGRALILDQALGRERRSLWLIPLIPPGEEGDRPAPPRRFDVAGQRPKWLP
jgi:Bacterial Ig-like domain